MASRQSQGTILFTALFALVGISVVVQLWLLTLSVEALLQHVSGPAFGAAIGSSGLFVVNALLLLYVFNFDRQIRRH